MKLPSHHRILSIACVFSLVAVGLMVWSLFDPRPVPVIVAMSLGQVIGTLSLLAFLFVVASDLRPLFRSTPDDRDSIKPKSP
ncbi:MAG: hypothetical protein ABI183_08620 [Polyangiaceae bacterium]